jgi:hypothetical protein
VAVGPDAGHGLLTNVTTFGEAHRLIGAIHFLRQVRLVDINAVDGHARLQAKNIERFGAGGRGTIAHQGVPDQIGAPGAEEVVTGQTESRPMEDMSDKVV